MARRPPKTAMVEALPTKIERKLKALEEVAGLLNDLSPEELRAFLELTQRRPLFGGRASD